MRSSFLKKLKRNRVTVLGALAAVLILGVSVGLVVGLRSCAPEEPEPSKEESSGTVLTSGTAESQTAQSDETTLGGTSVSETAAMTDTGVSVTESAASVPPETSVTSSEPPKTEQTTTPPVETRLPVTVPTAESADTERWLAAAAVVAVSMEYPDFELESIYLASATGLDDRLESKGVYITFKSGGESLCIHSVPIVAERTAAGTRDISSETVGFATFDCVSPSSVGISSMTEAELDDLGELISLSLLVSVYSR